MTYNNEKIGAFIVPTGLGASIGGYAGDASNYARELSKHAKLIVNPNVVNAGVFSGINEKMLYVEGFSLDSFFKGKINLVPSKNNKIGIIYDKAIPTNVLNIHINTQNAVNMVYGVNIFQYVITDENVGVDFYISEDNFSSGTVKNITTIEKACEKLLSNGCSAIAVVCLFNEPENDNSQYCNGQGVDPVGGVEAIISHCISQKFRVPCAHSPAFIDYSITSDIVDPKSASEYITPTFLPCILLGLSNAPLISVNKNIGINITDLDFLVMPYNCLGSTPVIESLNHGIRIFAVKENSTLLDITKDKLYPNSNIIEVDKYSDIYNFID